MAYFAPPKEDEENENAQQETPVLAPGATSSTGGFATGATVAGQQQSAPGPGAQQKQGTGFTNLSSWLNAGKGRDKQVSSTGTNLLGAEQVKFDEAAKPLQAATFTPTTMEDAEVASLIGAGSGANAPARGTAPPPSDDWQTKLSGLLEQDYTGPTSVDYDWTTGDSRDNLLGVDALSATDTTGAELAKRQGAGVDGYTAGERRLDASMFGADAESQAAIAGNKAGGSKFMDSSTKTAGELAAKAQGFKDAAAGARTKTHDQLRSIADSTTATIRARADAENARLADLMAAGAPTGKKNADWVGARAGDANVGNMMNDTEASAFDKLRALIGGDQPARTGRLTAGQRTYIDDPLSTALGPAANFGGDPAETDATDAASIVKTGQLGVYYDTEGNLVMKGTGVTVPKDRLPAYAQWAAGKSQEEIKAGLPGWLQSGGA